MAQRSSLHRHCRHAFAILPCALLLAACASGPGSPPDEELCQVPAQSACESVARDFLAARSDHPTAQFQSVHAGAYRLAMLWQAHPAWALDAEVTTHDANGEHAQHWTFFFAHDELVAVGAPVPHWNRSSWSDQWIVREVPHRRLVATNP